MWMNSAGQLNVLGHDGDPHGVDGAQFGVLKETNEVGFASFLKSHHSGALETQICLEILSDFSYKTLEGQLADQQLSTLLVTTDLTKSDCTRPVTMRFLESAGGRSALTTSYELPLWRAVYVELFHQLIFEQFALYEPSLMPKLSDIGSISFQACLYLAGLILIGLKLTDMIGPLTAFLSEETLKVEFVAIHTFFRTDFK